MKIVVNKCFGGFGLSDAAVKLFAKRKNIELFPEPQSRMLKTIIYWTVPPEQRQEPIANWMTATIEERVAWNRKYGEQTLNQREIPRNDSDLVAVVEELGSDASGYCSKLEITEIPDDLDWEIGEHDGFERVEERHRVW